MRAAFLATICFLLAGLTVSAADPRMSSDEMAAVASTLKWQTGTVTLRDGLAKITLSPGYRFLDGVDAEKVLHDLWGNPPGRPTLGMIFPDDTGPTDRNGWGVLIQYEEGGHVNDADAAKINYDQLLQQMQKQVRDENPQREQQGYPAVELVGWAEPPHYDASTHKLYWAKDLRIGQESAASLNYNIRVLGRRGVLVLNAVALMRDLPVVSQKMPEIMARVDFQPGNSYADFDPKIDKVAKYGIAALIAGGALGAAAKFGLFKAFWPFLFVFKKFAILIFVGIAAAVRKLATVFQNKSVVRPFDPATHAQPETRPAAPTLNPPASPTNLEPLRPPPAPRTDFPTDP
jgi:uncharacterized membrane-anchored protein